MTVEEWCNCWLSLRRQALAPRTLEQYDNLFSRYINPALGAIDLASLDAIAVQNLLATVCNAGHTRTAQLIRTLLSACCREAVVCGHLPANPVDRVLRPRHQRQEPQYWSPDELRTFVTGTRETRFAVAWQLALCCGLRRGELAGLRWEDVDLPAHLLHIRNQRQQTANGIIDGPPKSAAGRRVVPIPAGLVHLLGNTLTRQRAAAAAGAAPPIYVVAYANNKPIDPHMLNKELAAAIAAAHVRPINLHGLRHTMATSAISCGVSVKVLQSILGHAQFSTTADIYAHVLQSDCVRAIDAVAAIVL